MVLRTAKHRDRAKLERKKARLSEKKQRWRETHGMEKDPEVLVRSAFAALDTQDRAPNANPYAAAARAFVGARRPERKAGEAVFLAAARAELVEEVWLHPLLAAAHWRSRWIRRPQDWAPPLQTGRERRFRALLSFLFARYEVPRCFAEPFLRNPDSGGPPWRGDPRQRWLIEIAQGLNLRHCPGLPFKLSARMAHYALRAPGDLSLYQTLRWGQCLGLGGDEALAAALCRTPICRPLPELEELFWAETVELLSRETFLAAGHIGPLIDYLRFTRFGETGPITHPQRVAPPQPGLSVRRRALTGLLRESEAWHRRRALHQHQTGIALEWKARGWNREADEGSFIELTSSLELQAEGEALSHCIATYARACHSGDAVVVAFRPHSLEVSQRLTLHIAGRQLREVRGRFNRLPTESEWPVLEAWADGHGIKIPKSLRETAS